MVHEPLASVLRSGRDIFNAKFSEARRRYPDLDGAVLQEFIQSTLDPIASAAGLPADQLAPIIVAGYDVGLELVGEHLTGKGALEDAWRRIAPANGKLTATSPRELFAAISNAVHQLATNRASRVEEWISNLAALAGRCPDLATLLKVGQVLAWRAGMAQWRSSALAVAANLPPSLARAAVGASEPADWDKLLERLRVDVWFDPRAANSPRQGTLRQAVKVGAFRGLGGSFPEPPVVAAAAEQLFVRSGERCWLLIADVFGHSLHHASPEEFERARLSPDTSPDVRVTATTVTARGQQIPNPAPGALTSFAVTRNTIAVTSSFSHAVVLLSH